MGECFQVFLYFFSAPVLTVFANVLNRCRKIVFRILILVIFKSGYPVNIFDSQENERLEKMSPFIYTLRRIVIL